MSSIGGLCDELISRSEESYGQVFFVVCNLESSIIEDALARVGLQRHKISNKFDLNH